MNYYTDAMRRYFDFEGSATRSQFWLYTLILFGIMVAALAVDLVFEDPNAEPVALFTGLIMLVHFIPSLSISARRLHDSGKSAWWLLFMLMPGIGSIVLLIFMCAPTQTINNQYVVSTKVSKNSDNEQAIQPNSNSSLNQLEKIASLRASGAIDEEEFKQLKAGVLSRPSQ